MRFSGRDASLHCDFDTQGEELYSVKWYKVGETNEQLKGLKFDNIFIAKGWSRGVSLAALPVDEAHHNLSQARRSY